MAGEAPRAIDVQRVLVQLSQTLYRSENDLYRAASEVAWAGLRMHAATTSGPAQAPRPAQKWSPAPLSTRRSVGLASLPTAVPTARVPLLPVTWTPSVPLPETTALGSSCTAPLPVWMAKWSCWSAGR